MNKTTNKALVYGEKMSSSQKLHFRSAFEDMREEVARQREKSNAAFIARIEGWISFEKWEEIVRACNAKVEAFENACEVISDYEDYVEASEAERADEEMRLPSREALVAALRLAYTVRREIYQA